MTDPMPTPELQIVSQSANGCGCGCAATSATDTTPFNTSMKEILMSTETTQTFRVTGMTCGHCAQAVTTELQAIDGVSAVDVDLVAGGASTVTVSSATPLDRAQVAVALDEAGDYQLA